MSVVADLCEAILAVMQASRSVRPLCAAAGAGGTSVYGQREAGHGQARRRFQTHQYYVPEMLIACRAMKATMNRFVHAWRAAILRRQPA